MGEAMKKAEDVKVTITKDQSDPDKVIYDHVGFSLIAGAIPIPFLDIVAVTAIQLDMIKQLAKIYSVDFDDEVGKSLVTSIIGSAIGTSIGRAGASAVKAIPGIGTLLGIGSQVALSGITTYAVGFVFNAHFRDHKTLTDFDLNDVKEAFDDLLRKGKEFVDDLMKKTETAKKETKEETAMVIRGMYEKGIIKKIDFEKIIKEIHKEDNK